MLIIDHLTPTKWSSYDRTWLSGPDKQEVFFFILKTRTKEDHSAKQFQSSEIASRTYSKALTKKTGNLSF
jgi:hypothetical protein